MALKENSRRIAVTITMDKKIKAIAQEKSKAKSRSFSNYIERLIIEDNETNE